MTTQGLFRRIGPRLWVTTRCVNFTTRYGDVLIEEGTLTDLFSCVDNTGHPEFWLAALLHDETRRRRRELGWTRHMTDLVFRDEMMLQSFNIYTRMLDEGWTKADATEELWRLLHKTRLYYKGVSGILGTLYMIFND